MIEWQMQECQPGPHVDDEHSLPHVGFGEQQSQHFQMACP